AGLGLANVGTTQCLIQHNLFKNNNVMGPISGTAIYTDQFFAPTLSNVLINENLFENNDSAAIGLGNTDINHLATSVTISNNTITDCGRGIYIFGTTSSMITGNLIENLTAPSDAGSSTGIGIFGGASSLSITGNTIENGVKYGVRIDNLVDPS